MQTTACASVRRVSLQKNNKMLKTELVRQRRNTPQDKTYRDTLGDAQFAVLVLLVASGTLIFFTLAATLWLM
ncbi:hypothetical protein HF675_10080 [Serratia sp. JUb9]|uniref:hypothetical protein n=1 Tax=unclassified Serratia (in: enterobacteria) TaxID=2647522 RepID=UPI00164DD8AD|nr:MULTISPECIES: hypothetical protein [unclassified Serratia (in: enterobacteria)]MBU3894282.1 hypothetical protein [Serratia rubidaea]QNK34953.1 hypothetical protein HF675_10080 [Serratia sp. JUb9]QPT15883.1 hypothetical protein I6G37_14615 [Serratia rubidaea]